MKTARSIIALVAATAAMAGCGGSGEPAPTPHSVQVPPSSVPATEVKRQLGNAFQTGLERLAVMSQPREDAADLGQDLPTGSLTSIACGEPASCVVRWRTVAGRPQSTAYVVRAFRGGCVTARANPPLPSRWDATIQTTSENPLNTLVGTGRGCA